MLIPEIVSGGSRERWQVLFAQLMDFLPWTSFARSVNRYDGDCRVRSLSCAEQFRAMAFAQLTYRESLRDIEVCLSAQPAKLYPMGFRSPVRRSTLAEANESRDWRIYAELAQRLMLQARKLYAQEDLGVDLDAAAYALDSTTIDLCLGLFPWAHFRSTKAAVKMHTLLDLRGNIPTFIRVTTGDVHDVNILDEILHSPAPITSWIAAISTTHGSTASTWPELSLSLAPRATSTPAASTPTRPTSKPASLPTSPSLSTAMTAARIIQPPAPHPLPRPGHRQTPGLPYQPVHPVCGHHLRPLQKPLADRAVLQVDQAAPAHQGLLRNQRKRGQNQIWIAVSVYVLVAIVKKTPRSPRLALHFAASHLSYFVRENAHFTGTSAERLHKSTAN